MDDDDVEMSVLVVGKPEYPEDTTHLRQALGVNRRAWQPFVIISNRAVNKIGFFSVPLVYYNGMMFSLSTREFFEDQFIFRCKNGCYRV